MATVEELKTLRGGDFIEASGLYYKVIGLTKRGLYLSHPFAKGSTPREGLWFSRFYSKAALCDHPHWNIVRADSFEAKALRV
jgi:hypothetical protein